MKDIMAENDQSRLPPYTGPNMRVSEAIGYVLERIPNDARELVMDTCLFVSAASTSDYGSVEKAWVPENGRKAPYGFHIIVLSESAIGTGGIDMKASRKGQLRFLPLRRKLLRYVIAHEIAHVYLEHMGSEPGEPKARERETDRLVAEWGFPRLKYLGENDGPVCPFTKFL